MPCLLGILKHGDMSRGLDVSSSPRPRGHAAKASRGSERLAEESGPRLRSKQAVVAPGIPHRVPQGDERKAFDVTREKEWRVRGVTLDDEKAKKDKKEARVGEPSGRQHRDVQCFFVIRHILSGFFNSLGASSQGSFAARCSNDPAIWSCMWALALPASSASGGAPSSLKARGPQSAVAMVILCQKNT